MRGIECEVVSMVVGGSSEVSKDFFFWEGAPFEIAWVSEKLLVSESGVRKNYI